MSCVLLATLGSLGDLHPYIAVGRALRSRGQRVRLATSSDYRSRVEAAGLEFAPLAPSLAELGEPSHIARQFFARWRGPRRLICAMVSAPLQRACADLRAAMEGASLVVAHPLTPALPLLAQSRGVPWLSSVLAPYSLLSMSDPPVMPTLDWLRRLPGGRYWVQPSLRRLLRSQLRRLEGPLHALRAELGLPPIRESLLMGGSFSPLGTLALFDPALALPQRDWPPHTFVSGAALYDAAAAEFEPEGLHERLESFLTSGPPPLVFALGSSAVWLAQDFWKHAIAACQKLGQRGLLLTGVPLEQSLPATVAAFEYLPYSSVFPRAAAVIHQAGIGTLSQALRSARPQLLTPAGFDQPDNAARAARLGIGRILPFHRAHDDSRLVRELRALLDEPAHQRIAVETSIRLRGIDGAAAAAERILAA